MPHEFTTDEWARHFNVSPSTIQRWQRIGAPLDDDAAMELFRMRLRSRTGVSKNNRRTTAVAPAPAETPEPAESDAIETARFYESEIEAIVNAFLALRETYPDASAALTKVARESAGWLLTID
jgi:hypothetical protein